MQRRAFLQSSTALSLLGLTACATTSIPTKARVVVVGGGYGGATAAKYVRLLSDYKIDVVLIEPNEAFVSCPISNLVIGGSKTLSDITTPYDHLSGKHGVQFVKDMVSAIDAKGKRVTLAGGASIGYDKLILSPGIDMMWDSIEGAREANASGQILQGCQVFILQMAWPGVQHTQGSHRQTVGTANWNAGIKANALLNRRQFEEALVGTGVWHN